MPPEVLGVGPPVGQRGVDRRATGSRGVEKQMVGNSANQGAGEPAVGRRPPEVPDDRPLIAMTLGPAAGAPGPRATPPGPRATPVQGVGVTVGPGPQQQRAAPGNPEDAPGSVGTGREQLQGALEPGIGTHQAVASLEALPEPEALPEAEAAATTREPLEVMRRAVHGAALVPARQAARGVPFESPRAAAHEAPRVPAHETPLRHAAPVRPGPPDADPRRGRLTVVRPTSGRPAGETRHQARGDAHRGHVRPRR